MNITQLQSIYNRIISDPKYAVGIKYGRPRPGHAEGTVERHIEELEQNLQQLVPDTNSVLHWKLKILIHVHDTFKYAAKRDSSILDPHSHATLAAKFLSEFMDDSEDMLTITQYHDLGFSLYKNFKKNGVINEGRLRTELAKITDKDLFLYFVIIDSCTKGKGREAVNWWVNEVHVRYNTNVVPSMILPGDMIAPDGSW